MNSFCRFSTVFLVCLLNTDKSEAQIKLLEISECHQLAKQNYPLVKKLDLIARTKDYELSNANKHYAPQVSFSAQMSYQSQSIEFTDLAGLFPGVKLPSISKDQYKTLGEINQLIYDGGMIENQKRLIKTNSMLEQQELEVRLYSITEKVNTLYFSILLIDAQLAQNAINIASLRSQEKKIRAALKLGTDFRSSLDELLAEIGNLEMIRTEFQFTRSAYLKMLSLFIGKQIPDSVNLEIPETTVASQDINRVELKTFSLKKSMLDVQQKQLRSENLPQISAFFQGAYGRPTLNIINNKFGPWYLTGVKLSWSIGSLYTLGNKKKMLEIGRQSLKADEQTFLLNTRVDLSMLDEQVKKFESLITLDQHSISLRASVAASARAQLDNGVITVHEYIQKVNAELLSRELKILHEIQLLQAKYNRKFVAGNQ